MANSSLENKTRGCGGGVNKGWAKVGKEESGDGKKRRQSGEGLSKCPSATDHNPGEEENKK